LFDRTTAPGKKLREWHSKVYRAKDSVADFYDSSEWKTLKRAVFGRDHFLCQRCLAGRRRELTCHHIVPVLEGGNDSQSNLITLCERCHTIVEADEFLRTAQLIKNSLFEAMPLPLGVESSPLNREEQPAWHAWVYGGDRNPNI